jgi:transcriptional regulator with XRE-family HTH domain
MDQDQIREWLNRGLKKPGKSQAGLARHLGLAAPQMNRAAKGTRRIQLAELARIAEYLEEPVPFPVNALSVDAELDRVAAPDALRLLVYRGAMATISAWEETGLDPGPPLLPPPDSAITDEEAQDALRQWMEASRKLESLGLKPGAVEL